MQFLEGGGSGPNGRERPTARSSEQDPADADQAPGRGSLMARYRETPPPAPAEDQAPPTGECRRRAGAAGARDAAAGRRARGQPVAPVELDLRAAGAARSPRDPAGPAVDSAGGHPHRRQLRRRPPRRSSPRPPRRPRRPRAGALRAGILRAGVLRPAASSAPASTAPAVLGPGVREAASERPAPRSPPTSPPRGLLTEPAPNAPVAEKPADKPADVAPAAAPASRRTSPPRLRPPTARGLLSAERSAEFRRRWRDLQADFVDDPQEAVRGAGDLSRQILQALADTIADAERVDRWKAEDGTSGTEDLRVALRQYRTLVDRLLEL